MLKAYGRRTGAPAVVQAPNLDFASVQVQRSASLSIGIRITGPPDALDGRVAAGSPFTVAARFTNGGQAATSGAELLLRLSGGLTLVGSQDTVQVVNQGVDARWDLSAPVFDTTARAIVRFNTIPQELNTTQDATIADSIDTVTVRIVFEAPPLTVTNVTTGGGAVDSEYVPLSWTWNNTDATGAFPLLIQNLEIEALAADGNTVRPASDLAAAARLSFGSTSVPATTIGQRIVFWNRQPAPGSTRRERGCAGSHYAPNHRPSSRNSVGLHEAASGRWWSAP